MEKYGVQTIAPKEHYPLPPPRLALGFRLGLGLGLGLGGGGNFARGNCPRTGNDTLVMNEHSTYQIIN